MYTKYTNITSFIMFEATLFKLDVNGKMRSWSIKTQDNAYQTTSGQVGGKQIISQWTYVEGKSIGQSNETTPTEQAEKEAAALARIRTEHGWCTSPEEAKSHKDYFHCMLADKIQNVKNLVIDEDHPVYIQRKLDGARNIDSIEGMQTRSGKTWVSAPHIQEKLMKLFEKYPDLMFDGELYYHSDEDNFNEVISMIKKTKPTEEDLQKSAQMVQYWIYDLPSCPGTFSERNAEINRLFAENPDILDSSFVNVETIKITSREEIDKYLEQFVSEGFEGAIVRLDTPYENKRTKNLLKVKKFQDEEFTILDIEEGKGKFYGHAGRIIVDVDGKPVSTGLRFTHAEMKEIWERRDYYIGKKATVKYFNKTVDGSLRFPKTIQIDRESYE